MLREGSKRQRLLMEKIMILFCIAIAFYINKVVILWLIH